MKDFSNDTLLVIAPHPDDEVMGCGGLISRIKEDGGKIFILFLTNGNTKDFTSRGVSTLDEREKEILSVSKFLKYDGFRIAFSGDKYHLKLDQVSQKEIINEIERGKDISLEVLKPDIIAFPFHGDYNQDHSSTAKAAFSACRPSLLVDKFVPNTILSYEETTDHWSTKTIKPNYYVELTKAQIDKKIKALGYYESQLRGKGHPRNTKVVTSLANLRGSNIGVEFAEGYHCHRFKA